MSTIATASPTTGKMSGPKEQFLDGYRQENEKTLRVLRAYPKDKTELRPHARCKTARELAWMFVLEQGFMERAVTTGFDWSKPPQFPPAPESYDAILAAFEQGVKKNAELVRALPEEKLFETIKFPTGPKAIGDVPRLQFLWMNLCDQIHHRGQFSIYLRMADGKVPSIYGPTADEPWF